ncbi:MAG: hypothetical protein M3014_01995 [Chloroflexota bacterium]|nr:hypothetical protein [Chloroflexota bacterium]
MGHLRLAERDKGDDHDGIQGEGPVGRGVLVAFLLEVRPHVIGILRAVNKVSGASQKATCPQCGHQFKLDK